QPMILGCGSVYFTAVKSADGITDETCLLAKIDSSSAVDWQGATSLDVPRGELEQNPAEAAAFTEIPPAATKPTSFDSWKRSLAETLYRVSKLDLFRSAALDETSRPGESER